MMGSAGCQRVLKLIKLHCFDLRREHRNIALDNKERYKKHSLDLS